MARTSENVRTLNGSGARRFIPNLQSPHPLSSTLPALYQEDDFACSFISGLDAVLAPLFCTLDNLAAYFDPHLAPEDFVEWLSDWVGVVLDDSWPIERRRALVGQAVQLYRRRGTVGGLRDLVTVYTGSDPEITDSGGAAWSPVPGGSLPGSGDHHLTIRLSMPQASPTDMNRLAQLVAEAKPAHVTLEIDVIPELGTPP